MPTGRRRIPVFAPAPSGARRISLQAILTRIWSPLSGRILATNKELSGAVDLIDRAPFDRGWLARIEPLDLESERWRLTSRPAGAD